jgi:glycoside hydrolase-like protein
MELTMGKSAAARGRARQLRGAALLAVTALLGPVLSALPLAPAAAAPAPAVTTSRPTPARPAPAVRCDGTSYSYTGKANSDSWSAEKNWDPNGVPGSCASDSVTIQPDSDHAFPALQVPASTTLSSLSLATPDDQGSISLSGGSLTITGSFTWSGFGNISTPVTASGSDNDRKVIQAPATFSLAGTATVSGTGLTLSGGGASIVNTGTFSLQPGAVLSAQVCCVSLATFVNQGTVTAPGSPLGNGLATISAVGFRNTASAVVEVAPGNVLALQVAPSTLPSGVTIGGGGTLLIDNTADVTATGTVNLADGTTLQLGLDQNNSPGTLAGTATLRGSGAFSWTGGDLTADLTVSRPVTTSITGPAQKILDDTGIAHTGLLALDGPASVSGTGLVLGGSARLTSTGTLQLLPGAEISAFSCCVAPAQLVNRGRLVVPGPSGGGAATIGAVTLDNTAAGTVTIARGNVLNLQVAPSALASGSTVGGGGNLLIDNQAVLTLGGTTTLADGTTVTLGLDQNQSAGALSGTGTLRGDGAFAWTGGVLTGDVTVASPVKASITGDVRKVLEDTGSPHTGLLTLGGASVLSGTGLEFFGPAKLTNAGTLTPKASAAISASSCCVNPGQFVNDGKLDVDVGAGQAFSVTPSTSPGLAVVNHGTVAIKSGTLQFSDPGYTQTAGQTQLAGGALATTGSTGVVLKGGSLTGAGTITGPVTNDARIDPGTASHAGVITVNGAYTQAAGGTLAVDLRGDGAPGTGYDQLAVHGAATLRGDLAYSTGSYTPKGTDFFSVLTYTSHTGQFTALNPAVTKPRYWVNYQPAAAVFSYGPWGIDTSGGCGGSGCPTQITASFYADVHKELGTPDFWGRYIGDKQTSFPNGTCVQKTGHDYTKDISADEIDEARALGLPIWPVFFNYPETAVTGTTCGQNYARAAIEFALHHHIPAGTALFADIEPSRDVKGQTEPIKTDKEFIAGWYHEFATGFSVPSPYDPKETTTYPAGYYVPGYYGDTGSTDPGNFAAAYCAAVKETPAIADGSYIWASRPGLTATGKAGEPAWKARAPGCRSRTDGWQYNTGIPPPKIDADTDEMLPEVPLWHP